MRLQARYRIDSNTHVQNKWIANWDPQKAHVLLLKNSLVVAMFSSGSQLKPWSAMDSMTLEMVDPLSTLTVGDCRDIKNGILINGIKSAQILVCQSARDKLGWMSALRKIEVHFQEIEGDDDSAAVEGHQERTDWLYEVPEEMDVCIAQRNFEGAVKFATRARAEFEGSKALSGMVSLQRRIDEKVDKLTAALCSELRRPAIRTHAIRATVGFLLDLGKADLAHEVRVLANCINRPFVNILCLKVYLLNRSQRLKQKFRKVKMEGSTELYALKLSGTFFSTIRSTCVEYAEYFDESASSAFVSWASKELRRFASNFTHQVLQSLNKLQTVAQCVQKVMQQCGQLSDCGLDLSFVLWEMLETKTLEAINDAGQALLNTTSIDLDVEDWQAQEFSGNKYALKQLLEKMSHHQFEIETYIQKKRCSLFEVTTNCIGRVHEYVSAVLCLINLRLDDALLPWLVEVFGTIVKWLTRRADGSTIFQENMDALLTLLRQSRRRVEDVTGRECDILVGLEGDILSTWAHGSHTGSIV